MRPRTRPMLDFAAIERAQAAQIEDHALGVKMCGGEQSEEARIKALQKQVDELSSKRAIGFDHIAIALVIGAASLVTWRVLA